MNETNGVPKLPENWLRVKLSEIGLLVRGVSYEKQEASDTQKEGYLPILRANNIGQELNFKKLVYVPQVRVSDEQRISAFDIIIAMSSGSKDLVGKAAQAIHDYEGGFGAFCSLLRVTREVNQRYVGYFFQASEYKDRIAKLSSGVNINNLRREHIELLDVPFPPLAEQHRIVAKIEELFTELDAGVESLKKARSQLKRYRQAVLKAAVTGELTREWREAHKGELEPAAALLGRILRERRAKWEADQLARMQAAGKPPRNDSWKKKYQEPAAPKRSDLPVLPEGWTWTNFEQIAESSRHALKAGPFGSSLKKSYYVPSGYKIYGQEQVIRGNPFYGDYYIDGERFNLLKSCAIKPGDILISLVGTIGKVLILPEGIEPGIINPRLLKLSLERKLVNPYYIKIFLESPDAGHHFSLASHGGTMDILNLTILKELSIPLPPVAEQEEIFNEVERLLSIADATEKTIEQSLKQAERLRQSILQQAFAGKLVPQDPADEPAEILLKRIRAERTRNGSALRKPRRATRKHKQPVQPNLLP